MSEFDKVRDRLKRGNEARERVLKQVYSSQPVTQQTSEFDAVRNRSIETKPEPRPSFGFSNPLASVTPAISIQKNTPSVNELPNHAPVLPAAPSVKPKEEQIKDERAKQLEWFEKNGMGGLAKNVIQPFAETIDKLRFGSKAGRTIDRATQGAAEIAGAPRMYEPVETGSKALDVTADILKYPLSFAVNPAQIESNLLTGGYNAGNALLSTRGGAAATNLATRGIEKLNPLLNTQGINISRNLAEKTAAHLTRGSAAGAYAETAQGMQRGETSGADIARNAALGAAFGGAGDALIGIAGKAILEPLKNNKTIGNFIDSLGAKEAELGITPFAKKSEEFTNPLDTRSHIVSKTKKDPLNIPDVVNKFYERTTDNIQRINQFDKYIESATGKKLSPSERAYYLALNSRGSDMISKTILTEQLVDAQGNAIGKSLKSITEQIPKRNVVDFEDYLIAKHAETRMARGEKVYSEKANMTPEKLKEKISSYEKRFPEFKQIANELYDFQNKLGEAWLVNTGIISPDTWSMWREHNPFWIPNKRKFSDLEKGRFGGGAKKGFADQTNPVKAYSKTGSERQIISPLESIIEYTDQQVKTAKRNEVMQAIIKNIEKDPEAFKDFAEIVTQPEKPDDILNILMDENGIDNILARFSEDFDKAMQKPDLTKGNVIRGLVNGEPVHLKVNDPSFLEALTNLTPQGRNFVIEAARKATNVMKVLTTGVNPIFSLTRNIFYDIPQAYIYSKTTDNPFRFAYDLLDGVVSTIGNKELYRSYKAMGGGHSSSVAADRNLLAQSKRQILPQKHKGSLLAKGFNALENLSNVIESAPRLGEFKRITKRGGNTYDSRVEGLYEAQDVTTNFKRFGDITRDADAIFPYMNAAVQGLDKNIRAFKDRPAQTIMKSIAAITMPTIALYALNYNNPEYQKLSNYTKDRFFLFPTNDGKFVKIPKPRELGVPFGAMIERVLRQWNEDDPEAFRDFTMSVNIAFAPPGVGSLMEGKNPLRDTIGGALVELDANENFAGAPIVPGYLEGLSPRHQYDANTSEVAKFFGDKLNVSPKQIDHLIRSYGGFIGELGLPATTKGASLKDTLVKQVTADPAFSTDATSYFYDLKTKLDTQYKDAKLTGDVPEGYNDSVRKHMNQVANKLSDFSKEIREVDKSNLPSEEKKYKKRELTSARNELAREAYNNAKGFIK